VLLLGHGHRSICISLESHFPPCNTILHGEEKKVGKRLTYITRKTRRRHNLIRPIKKRVENITRIINLLQTLYILNRRSENKGWKEN
jgi:hypothetical protein